jgi:hypothetical protein
MDPMNLEKMSNVSLGDIPQCKSEFIGRLMWVADIWCLIHSRLDYFTKYNGVSNSWNKKYFVIYLQWGYIGVTFPQPLCSNIMKC